MKTGTHTQVPVPMTRVDIIWGQQWRDFLQEQDLA